MALFNFEADSSRLQYGAVVAALAVLGTSLTYTVGRFESVTDAAIVVWWLCAFTFISWYALRKLGDSDEAGE